MYKFAGYNMQVLRRCQSIFLDATMCIHLKHQMVLLYVRASVCPS